MSVVPGSYSDPGATSTIKRSIIERGTSLSHQLQMPEYVDNEAKATRVTVVASDGVGVNLQPQYASVYAYGTSSAPSAGTAIATIASGSLPAGYYEIVADVRTDGTPGTGDRDNYEVRRGATVISRVLIADVADAAPGSVRLYASLSGSEAVSVNATGAATAGTVYSSNIIATRLA